MLRNVPVPLKFNVFSRKNSNFFMHQTNGSVIRPLKNGLPNFQQVLLIHPQRKMEKCVVRIFFSRNPSIFIDDALKPVETHRATYTGRSIKVGACNVIRTKQQIFFKKYLPLCDFRCCFLCHLPNIRRHNVNDANLKILRQFFN